MPRDHVSHDSTSSQLQPTQCAAKDCCHFMDASNIWRGQLCQFVLSFHSRIVSCFVWLKAHSVRHLYSVSHPAPNSQYEDIERNLWGILYLSIPLLFDRCVRLRIPRSCCWCIGKTHWSLGQTLSMFAVLLSTPWVMQYYWNVSFWPCNLSLSSLSQL